jgi:hypothetical protein
VTWRLLARTIAAAHIAFVLFVLLGSILVLHWPHLLWLHLLAVTWAGLTLIFDLGCPLTPWEKQCWRSGGVTPYEEGFLQHHLLKTRFDPANEQRNHIMLGLFAIALNVVIYTLVFVRS